MTIGAIGSFSYSSSLYKKLDTGLTDVQIQELMKKYGIKPTGNKSADLQALYQAMCADIVSSTNANQYVANQNQNTQNCTHAKAASAETNVPWAALMAQVGLTATGNYDKDYEAFNDRIEAMQQSLSGRDAQEGDAYIAQLQAEASVVFSKPIQTSHHHSASHQQKQVSGADILAQMNKKFFLG